MRNNKNLPLILGGAAFVLLLMVLLVSGVSGLLSGTAGSFDPTATPTLSIGTPLPEEGPIPDVEPTPEGAPTQAPSATPEPSPTPDSADLSVAISLNEVTCQQVSFSVSATNHAVSGAAGEVEISVQITNGAQYISGNAGANLRLGSLSAGQTKSVQVSFSANSAWTSANAGAAIVAEARIRNETSNPSNIGRSASASAANPGGCGPTATPRVNPTATPTPESAQATATPENAQGPVCTVWTLFHSERDGNLDIYRLDGGDGAPNSRLYNLSGSNGEDRNPTRSGDGLWVAYQSDRNGHWDIYLTDVAGQNQSRLSSNAGDEINPLFNPDNRNLVYQSNRSGNWDLYIYDRISRQERQLTNAAGDEINPTWSASGQLLAYESNQNGQSEIVVLNWRSDESRTLTSGDGNKATPAWSPDGQHIAYLQQVDGNWQVFYRDANGSGAAVQVSNSGSANGLAWAPNSRMLAYASERNGNLDIYFYVLASAQETRLTSAAGEESAPSWNCTSSEVYYTARDGQGLSADIEKIALQGGQPVKVTNNPAGDYDAVMAGSKSNALP